MRKVAIAKVLMENLWRTPAPEDIVINPAKFISDGPDHMARLARQRMVDQLQTILGAIMEVLEVEEEPLLPI